MLRIIILITIIYPNQKIHKYFTIIQTIFSNNFLLNKFSEKKELILILFKNE